ncbi:uncharacterized small membrane protein [Bernardetia litoralis DSM 6794]|uniref:Uncharacterized small membrane protein n=1 Tax=Bernardetia litoralis (strain ATCC 23117 / DSM 6794 / NBRC 15988 / NCIMB 1366 / Fx l1 / Sio-4) TaxID=880071 RepID=I4APS8_BERLS|nr:DUF423 domain-containing protein [Bernardetia litoralis]AFM05963.1 uncharacterized small membrane protein [Bernardetia litoralis DSM 6794]
MKNNFIFLGAILGALAVGIGAFGAHALKDWLISIGQVETFQTASKYHFYHVFSIILIGILIKIKENNSEKSSKLLAWAGNLHLLGILFFSGSLYILCLTGTKWLGAITPIGGVLLIVGWVFLAFSFLNKK